MKEKECDLNILLIEDHPDIVKMYTVMFEARLGGVVHVAKNKRDALDVASKVHPQLVLVDLMIPEVEGQSFEPMARHGFEVMEEMKKHSVFDGVKYVVLTNLESSADRKRAANLGVEDYIIKSQMLPSAIATRLCEIMELE